MGGWIWTVFFTKRRFDGTASLPITIKKYVLTNGAVNRSMLYLAQGRAILSRRVRIGYLRTNEHFEHVRRPALGHSFKVCPRPVAFAQGNTDTVMPLTPEPRPYAMKLSKVLVLLYICRFCLVTVMLLCLLIMSSSALYDVWSLGILASVESQEKNWG